jgi:hypothetical protein
MATPSRWLGYTNSSAARGSVVITMLTMVESMAASRGSFIIVSTTHRSNDRGSRSMYLGGGRARRGD